MLPVAKIGSICTVFLLLGGWVTVGGTSCQKTNTSSANHDGDASFPDGGLGDATSGPAADGPEGDRPHFLERLYTPTDFSRVQGEGGEVKYLMKAGEKGLPPVDKECMFQDTARFLGHITFLRSFPELSNLDFATYLNLTLKNASRVLWGGELKTFSGARHPRTGIRGVMAYFVYADTAPTEALTLEQIKAVDTRIKACVPYAKDLLVLAPEHEIQYGHFQAQAQELAALGVDVIDPRLLLPSGAAEGYSLGEGYGYLTVSKKKPANLGPRDVLVTESAFEDLSLVAGLVTALPQNLHSHVNLRLREKGIPNAVVPDIFQNPVVSLLSGKLVHLTVEAQAVRIEPALLESALPFWESRRPKVPAPTTDLTEARLQPIASLGAEDAVAWGNKAANLGELARALPAENTVLGFGIPFSTYQEFLTATGLQSRLDLLLADERMEKDATYRRTNLASLQKSIEDATFPATLLNRIFQAIRTNIADVPTLPLRFRSSSNAEDGVVFSGAGLYDSARGCLADDQDADDAGPSLCLSAAEKSDLQAELSRRQAEYIAHPERDYLPAILDDLTKDLTRERSVARAVKKVYASLWNERAYEDRAYYGIDQKKAVMGVAVEPSFVLEKLDAVAVTHLAAGEGGPLYRVVSQRDRQGVVRPADPTLVPETMTFRRGPDNLPYDFQILAYSSLSTSPLWSEPARKKLAALCFAAQDHFAAQVYASLPHVSLDLEIKVTADDRVVIKQARLYTEP